MKKILPLMGCVCGVLSVIGMICGVVWDLPKPVWLLIALGLFAMTATIIYHFYEINKKSKR